MTGLSTLAAVVLTLLLSGCGPTPDEIAIAGACSSEAQKRRTNPPGPNDIRGWTGAKPNALFMGSACHSR